MQSLLFFLAFLTATYDQTDLNGKITDTDEKPVSGAKVIVYQAGVRTGISPYCPSCYADCAKKTVTDSDGKFILPKLSDELLFTILIVADGYEPRIVGKVDPKKGDMKAKLTARDLSKFDPKQIVRGKFVNENGKPIANVVVEPYMFKTENVSGSENGDFDPIAVTDKNGEFVVKAKSKITNVICKVEARGYAKMMTKELIPEKPDQTISMSEGAFVTGRLMQNGKPIIGAEIGLCGVDRKSGVFLGEMTIGTDEDGKFLFSNVPSNTEYFLYTKMNSLKEKGGVPARKMTVRTNGQTDDVGDVELQKGHTVTGRVITSDGKPIPKNTRLLLSNHEAWDSQIIEMGEKGEFRFVGVPDGGYAISTYLKGYHMSEMNEGYSYLHLNLIGRIENDISGLGILYQSGELKDRKGEKYDNAGKYHRAQMTKPMRGVVIEKEPK